MSPERMDVLLRQAVLDFTPVKGGFDPDLVARSIADLGVHFRDPVDPRIYVVTSDAALAQEFEARRKADPEAALPPTLRISVSPERIFVGPSAFEEEAPLTRTFITWLTSTYECRISNDEGVDLAPAE